MDDETWHKVWRDVGEKRERLVKMVNEVADANPMKTPPGRRARRARKRIPGRIQKWLRIGR